MPCVVILCPATERGGLCTRQQCPNAARPRRIHCKYTVNKHYVGMSYDRGNVYHPPPSSPRIAALVVRQFAAGVGDRPTDDRHLVAPVDLLPERVLESYRGSVKAVGGGGGSRKRWDTDAQGKIDGRVVLRMSQTAYVHFCFSSVHIFILILSLSPFYSLFLRLRPPFSSLVPCGALRALPFISPSTRKQRRSASIVVEYSFRMIPLTAKATMAHVRHGYLWTTERG